MARNDTGPDRSVMFHKTAMLAGIYNRRNHILKEEHDESWADMLLENVFSVLAEDDPEKLYVKLNNLSKITDNWMSDIENVRN